MAPQYRGRCRRSGFTLIELVVVMTILAIGFFAVRPAIGTALRSSQRRSVVRRLVSLLTRARAEAVARGRLVRVWCDVEAGEFRTEAQVDPAVDRSEFAPLTSSRGSTMRLPEDFSVPELVVDGADALPQGGAELYFYPDGSSDGLALTLESPSGHRVMIDLMATTGKVTLSD